MINNVLLPLGFIIIIWLHSLKTDTNNTFKMCLQTIHITIYSDTLLEFYRLFLKNNVVRGNAQECPSFRSRKVKILKSAQTALFLLRLTGYGRRIFAVSTWYYFSIYWHSDLQCINASCLNPHASSAHGTSAKLSLRHPFKTERLSTLSTKVRQI